MKEANERHFAATTDAETGDVVLTGQHKLVLGLFGAAFAVMIYGVIPWEDLGIGLPTLWWWFPEMTASFLLFAILIGVVARMKEGELTTTFVDGARDLLGVALIIGIARGITVVMNNGQITDTVLHWAEEALGDVGEGAFAVVMYLLFLPLSFLIPSTSGLATVAMPIMAPLAGFAGVNESLVVTAYQSASGLINLVTPTSAVVMGGLAIARVPYGKYLRFVWPLLIILGRLVDRRPRARGPVMEPAVSTDALSERVKRLMPQAKEDLARMVSFKSVYDPRSLPPPRIVTTWSTSPSACSRVSACRTSGPTRPPTGARRCAVTPKARLARRPCCSTSTTTSNPRSTRTRG